MYPARIILASASPRRHELLDQLGVRHEVLPADIHECPHPGEAPEAYVQRIAAEKSLTAQRLSGNRLPVMAADTEVVLDGEIFGKPVDEHHANAMLTRLSGGEHRVLSAVSLRAGGRHWTALNTSIVRFGALAPEDIAAYWASGEPRDKAGAYAIQGLASRFIPRIEGSYTNVVGLPVESVSRMLTEIRHQLPGPPATTTKHV